MSEEQKEQVEAVAVDMWPAFTNSVETNVRQADIVHDRFHISKYLNEAVDKVRRQEHKALKTTGDERLTGQQAAVAVQPREHERRTLARV